MKLVVSGMALANPYVGQGVYTLRLLAALEKQSGVDYVVVAPSQTTTPEIPEEKFVHLPSFRGPRNKLLNHAIVSQRLLHFVNKRFPDCIFHSPGPITGLTTPRQTVVTLHDCLYRHFSNYNGRFLVRRMLSLWAERFAASGSLVLTDSKFSRQDLVLKANIPASKIEILYPWVGNEFLQPIPPEALRAVREKFDLPEHFWLYLGGYDHRKNIEFLLEAYAAATREHSLPPLVLAGKIPARRNRATCDVTQALAHFRLTDAQIPRPGIIPAEDLPALYCAAALFVYPSLMEGFGLPPAEATAVGTPLLASNSSSLPEVVHNFHCLFDPHNLGSLVAKLAEAAEEESQFLSKLPLIYTESYGIARYLEVIGKVR